MKRILFLLTSLIVPALLVCKPKPPILVLHNSCSGYTRLRAISFPTSYTKARLDSLGLPDSVGQEDTACSYRLESRIVIHPDDRIWLHPLQSVFPESQVLDGDRKGVVHVWVGIAGVAFDSMPFPRRILVLNGTGKPGLARDVSYRFSVKFGLASLEPQTADADTFTKTVFYCSEDDLPLASKLRDYLGAGGVQSRTDLRDMILVLGTDVLEKSKANPASNGISIVVKKSLFTMFIYKNGTMIKKYPVAIGKNPGDKKRVGDNRTPEGDFTITSIQDSHTWEHDFADDTLGPIKGAYGPWFMGLSTLASETRSGKAWKGIAVHGTHNPASIGTRASEGCIRMHNEDVDSLKRMVRIGTPVRIEE
jgi:lipoprotein-anchoring transpeptidase ErfK/SrfK